MEWKFLKELKIFLAGKGFITKFEGDTHTNSILADAVAVSPEKFTPQIYHEVREYLNNSEYAFSNVKIEADGSNWHIKFSLSVPEVFHAACQNEHFYLNQIYTGFSQKDAILSMLADIANTISDHDVEDLTIQNNRIYATDERGEYYWECKRRHITLAEFSEIINEA